MTCLLSIRLRRYILGNLYWKSLKHLRLQKSKKIIYSCKKTCVYTKSSRSEFLVGTTLTLNLLGSQGVRQAANASFFAFPIFHYCINKKITIPYFSFRNKQTYQYEINQTKGSFFKLTEIVLIAERYQKQCLDCKDQVVNNNNIKKKNKTDIITKQKIKYLKKTPFFLLVLKV